MNIDKGNQQRQRRREYRLVRSSSFHNYVTRNQQQHQQQKSSRKMRSHSIHKLPSQLEFNLLIEKQQRQENEEQKKKLQKKQEGEFSAKEGSLPIAYYGQNYNDQHVPQDNDYENFYEVKEEHDEEGRVMADAANNVVITTAGKVGFDTNNAVVAEHPNDVAKIAPLSTTTTAAEEAAAVIPPIFKEYEGGINEIRTYKMVHETTVPAAPAPGGGGSSSQQQRQQSRQQLQQQQQKPSSSTAATTTTTPPPTMDQIQATMKNARRGLLSQRSRRKVLEGMMLGAGGGDDDDDLADRSSGRAGSSGGGLLDGELSSAADNGGRNVINSNSISKSNISTSINTTNSSITSNGKKQPNNNPNIDILTEGQYFLSISMLVYMYSQLRETCRMGHTRVTMEEIDCNNSCDQKMQQYHPLLPPSLHRSSSLESSARSEQSECSYLGDNTTTLTAGSIIRIVIDELEEEQDDIILNDPTTDEQHRQYEKFMMIQFKQWIEDSRVSQLDASTEELIKMLRKKAAVARWKRAKNLILMGRILSRGRLSGMDSEDGGNNNNNNNGGDDGGIDETNANPNKKQMIHYLRRQVARYRWKRVINKVILAVRLCYPRRPVFGMNDNGDTNNNISAGGRIDQKGNRFVNLQAMLQEALAKQPSYFIEGSVMYNLVESSLEVVWFSDLSQSDVVYGICVQREEKKITVVFRGTVTAHNWAMNFRYNMMDVSNPVKDYYPGRAETLSLHSGFALYLLRKRKDTRMSKMDEIFEKVQQIGNELAPDGDYELCITGHSLGGALATLFAFYCGAKHEHVRIYTFASPRVGGEAFLYAYQHLERAGRIRHARFSCTNDIVPLIPFCNFEPDNLKFYKHVGMRVQLHDTGRIGKWRLRKRLDVTYPLHHDWPSQFARGLMNCILANPNTPLGYRAYHHLTEYQRRLHFAMTYRKALGSTVFFLDEKRHRLKSLEEYYAIRGSMESDVVAFTQTFLPATDWRRIIRKCTTLFLVAPLMYAWVNLLSVVTSAEIIIPKVAYWIFIEQLPRVVKAIPYYAILRCLLQLTLVLTFIMEMIKMMNQSNIIKIRWVKFKKIFGRLVIVTPLLTLWLKLVSCLTNMDVMNIVWLILQHTTHVWKLLPVLSTMMVPSLKISFVLSFVMIVLGTIIPIRERNSQWKRYEKRLGKLLLIVPLFVCLLFLLNASPNNKSPRAPDASSAGWGLKIDNTQNGQQSNIRSSSKIDTHKKYVSEDNSSSDSKLHLLREDLKPIQEYATGIKFEPTLDGGLYLVGAGVRKKSVIKVYAVAMYSTPQVLTSATSHASLHDTARTFDSSSSMTSFVLEMVYSAGAEKIAGAIGESVKPRYNGDSSDIGVLESLIVDGVKGIGGQAIKGTVFRFDCSKEGVSVSVNGADQGKASFEGLGSAFVDVFMDSNSVSPTLKDSCVRTWSTDEMKSVSASLVELANVAGNSSQDASGGGEESQDKPGKAAMRNKVESQLKPIQEYATSVVFDPKLDDGLYLVGAGVRKKSVIKVYAVALYSSASVLNAVTPATLHSVARTFDASTPITSFVLEMTYSAGAEKIGGAIAESVKPRYNGPAADVSVLESLIVEGVNKKGGQATKGTIFRFDCSAEGVAVSVDGSMQGTAKFDGMGSAFVDVFLDDNAVSPTLVSSCMDTWSNPQAKAMAASLLELDEAENNASTDADDVGDSGDEGLSAHLTQVEAQIKPIQEYATSVTFEPKLDENGLYLVGAGVRKKSVIKVYAVAMYSTPQVLLSATSHSSLHDAARTFDLSSSMTSFVLEMVYSAGAEKIAGAIAESVKPRHNGDPSDVDVLESLIVNGVNAIGGQAIKGTVFRFDCSKEGVSVSVNGADQGMASFEGLGSAFVDVFMDSNSVSPTLKDSCMSTWSNNEAKSIAASLVELDLNRKMMHETSDDGGGNTQDDGVEESSIHAADEIEQRNETMTTPSSSNDSTKSNEEHEPKLKVTAPPPPKQQNHLLKRVVKYAFPVF